MTTLQVSAVKLLTYEPNLVHEDNDVHPLSTHLTRLQRCLNKFDH